MPLNRHLSQRPWNRQPTLKKLQHPLPQVPSSSAITLHSSPQKKKKKKKKKYTQFPPESTPAPFRLSLSHTHKGAYVRRRRGGSRKRVQRPGDPVPAPSSPPLLRICMLDAPRGPNKWPAHAHTQPSGERREIQSDAFLGWVCTAPARDLAALTTLYMYMVRDRRV